MSILFLSRWFPFPPTNGSKLRIATLLRALSQSYEVILLSFSENLQQDAHNAEAQAICKEVHLVQWKPYNPQSLRARMGFFSPAPRFIVDTFSPEMATQITRLIQNHAPEAVIASQLDMASYARFFAHTPAMFEEVESGVWLRPANDRLPFYKRLRRSLTWLKQKRYLTHLMSYFRVATVASNAEREILKQICPAFEPVEVIPNCIELDQYRHVRRQPLPASLVFTGSFRYAPNYDAMVWFLSDIFPRVRARAPQAFLTITGDHANQPLPYLENVRLTGYVDDIMGVIAQAWCSVVPLRVGGGTRLKILEAMALGTPVVSTSKGAEGLEAQPGYHLLVADQPEDFAQAVIRLIEEPGLREYVAQNAFELVKEKYDARVVMPRFIKLVHQLSGRSQGSGEVL